MKYTSFDSGKRNFEVRAAQRQSISCRSRKILKNAPVLAIVVVHTAKNESLKIWGFSSFLQAYPHWQNNVKMQIESGMRRFLNMLNKWLRHKLNLILIVNRKRVLISDDRWWFDEHFARSMSKSMTAKFVGLRFFTIYGPWGRPDMMIMKYLNASVKKN